jgi:hypothetical protein
MATYLQIYLPNNPSIIIRPKASADKIFDTVELATKEGRGVHIATEDGGMLIPKKILGSCAFVFQEDDE